MVARLCALPPVPSPSPTYSGITLPAGTRVPVHVVGSLSSASAQAGQTFQIEAAQNVVVNGVTVIRAGAQGQGTVVKADRAAGNGHSGSLTVQFNWISAADGSRIQLSSANQTHAKHHEKTEASAATAVGVLTFGLGGLFAHDLVRGKDIVIDDRRTLDAFVAQTAQLNA